MREIRVVSVMIAQPDDPPSVVALEDAIEAAQDNLEVLIEAAPDKKPTIDELRELSRLINAASNAIPDPVDFGDEYRLDPIGSTEELQEIMLRRANWLPADELVLVRRADFDALRSAFEYDDPNGKVKFV